MIETILTDINLAGEPEKKVFSASPLLPERTAWYIPFTVEGGEERYTFHVVEIGGKYNPVAVYSEKNKNAVVHRLALQINAISKKLLSDLKFIEAD